MYDSIVQTFSRTFIIGFASLFLPQLSLSESHKDTLTEKELVAEVFSSNPELEYYESAIAAAKGEKQTSEAWANPELSTTFGNKRVSGDSGSKDGAAWSVALNQQFEWGSRVHLRRLIAEKDIELAEIGLSQFRNALVFKVQILAYDLFQSQERLREAREVTTRYQKLREVLRSREAAGVNSILEKRIIEAATLGLESIISDAELEKAKALGALNGLRGKPLDTEMTLDLRSPELPPSPSFDSLRASAFTHNFEYLLKKIELEKQGVKVDLAKNERYPSYTVGPYVANEQTGDNETQVGVALSIPLPVWNSNSGRISSEEARKQQAAASLALEERELERKIFEAASEYKIKRRELEKWRDSSIKDLKEAATLADEHYRTGAVPVGTYIEVQKQYLESLEILLRLKQEALHARQELEQLSGISLSKESDR